MIRATAVLIKERLGNQCGVSEIYTMNASLPVMREDSVRRTVAAGEFQSAEVVAGEALRLLQDQQAWRADASGKINEGWHPVNVRSLRLAPSQ